MNSVVRSIKAVSEEIRMRILLLLADREACVCELMEVFNMAQSKLSHHLIALRKAGFLHAEKRGKWRYYSVRTAGLNKTNSGLLNLLSRSLGRDANIKNDFLKFAAVNRRNVKRQIRPSKVKKGACPQCENLKK